MTLQNIEVSGEVVQLSPANLKPNPINPRLDHTQVEDLLPSIRANGVLVPLIVYNYDAAAGTATLCEGHRRWYTARVLNLPAVPCIVNRQMNDRDAAMWSFEVNYLRKTLSPLEAIKLIYAIMSEHALTTTDIAARFPFMGSAARITELVEVLEWPHYIESLVHKNVVPYTFVADLGRLAKQIAKALGRHVDDVRGRLALKVSAGRLRHRTQSDVIKGWLGERDLATLRTYLDADPHKAFTFFDSPRQALAFVSHLREVGRLAEVFEPASVPTEGRPRLRQNIAETIQKLTAVQRRIT